MVVYAQAGDDDVQVAGGLARPAWVYAGAGADRVKGGAGGDVLLGGAGEDLLVGGAGRDLMIGGAGADRLIGNEADDILVAGSTAYDGDQSALAAITAAWARADLDYAARTASLQAGVTVAGRTYYFKAKDTDTDERANTLFDDGAADVLTGGAGADWFVTDGQVRDRVTDWSAFEREFADDVTFMAAAVG